MVLGSLGVRSESQPPERGRVYLPDTDVVLKVEKPTQRRHSFTEWCRTKFTNKPPSRRGSLLLVRPSVVRASDSNVALASSRSSDNIRATKSESPAPFSEKVVVKPGMPIIREDVKMNNTSANGEHFPEFEGSQQPRRFWSLTRPPAARPDIPFRRSGEFFSGFF